MESPYIGRVVTLLQPLFAAASGLIVTWVATKVPGANLDGTELAGLFAVGTATAAAAAWKWVENRGKHEQQIVAAEAVTAATVPQTLVWNPKTNSYESEKVKV